MPIHQPNRRILLLLIAAMVVCFCAQAQDENRESRVDMRMHLVASSHRQKERVPPAVLWLKPLPGTVYQNFLPNGHYTLLQKNRVFAPHLLVVPVGSVVAFPNADPFFHNVFSLFNGKRFDLGMYEAGTTKEVNFSREGVSYIFCNIHPDMSAVVLALATPLYSVADSRGAFSIPRVPVGDYEMHVWIEGSTQPVLDRMTRRVQVHPNSGDLGVLDVSGFSLASPTHLNKFGQPYDQDSKPPY